MSPLSNTARQLSKQNGILAALPGEDYENLAKDLELVPLELGRVVYESGTRLEFAYFPTDCVVSLLSVTRDGSSAEIAISGNEGMVGIALFMGGETTSSRAVVQNAGYAFRVPAAVIKREFHRGGALQLSLLRYTQALITQMAQTALCNRHHSVEQQLCRWLLMSVDRLPSNRLEMTEELIADMLGVGAAGVAAAVGTLQAEGLIRYLRGGVTVLDRTRLELRACECYGEVRSEFERLGRLPGRSAVPQLSDFLTAHTDKIAAQWEAFRRTLLPATQTTSSTALHDELGPILRAIARDIDRDRAAAQPLDPRDPQTPAALYGARQHLRGFSLTHLALEYSALKSSVIALWRAHVAADYHGALDDLTRFDESVDRALAASMVSYALERARSRDTFLAILGHDLRTPLAAISMSERYLSRSGIPEGSMAAQALTRIGRGAAKMDAMISDLLDYTKTRLGQGLPIVAKPCDISQICEAAIEEMRSAHPDRVFALATSGDLGGSFDRARLEQAFANLLSNAVQHGAAESPVSVQATGTSDTICVHVKNDGPPIPADALQVIFNPLIQLQDPLGACPRRSTSMGLGLFIARTIVVGHGGTLEVESSSAAGTVFTARLPRRS